MILQNVIIMNKTGLHFRLASEFVRPDTEQCYKAHVEKDGREATAKRI